MSNAYADLGTLKSASVLNVTDAAHDERLLGLLEAASRWIDGYCGRRFAAVHGERRFDGRGRAMLAAPDLVAVRELRVRDASGRWESWPSDDWLLYPLNARPTEPGGGPYTRILLTSGGRRFPLNRAGIAVNGIWGYSDVREDAGLRVADSLPVAVGDTRVKVQPVSPDAAVPLSAGHTIRIDDEQLYVTAAAGKDGTALTVRRGVNGTAASAHAAGAGLSVYRYPEAVSEACLLQAADWWRERFAGPFLPAGGAAADGKDVGGVSTTARTLLAPYRRRNAVLGV